MTYSFTLTDEDTHAIANELGAVSLLEIYNEGPDACYYGTQQPQQNSTASTTNGSGFLTITAGNAPRVGMIASGTGIPAGAKVIAVSNNQVQLSGNCTATNTGVAVAFTPEDLFTAFLPIGAGETKSFTTDHASRFLQRGLTLAAQSGETCTVRIHKLLN